MNINYQEYEEDEKDIRQKEERPQYTMSCFNLVKIEVSQNCSQQRKYGIIKTTKIFHLKSAENKRHDI